MFSPEHSRFATFGVISQVPGEIIDSIWLIIDQNLSGVVPLGHLLRFDLLNTKGKLTVAFSQEGDDTQIAVDLPFDYQTRLPKTVMAYDDGQRQTILLPAEAGEH
ncbi:DUF960 domain-containing protein [Lacticaseibacillus parakribbianus]|uniref:DUF960 domain-containing protein n=1 Tax=Lacticaseibacillus parakribbianus TaxID=2970927 RepID=UPI0021CB6933|nr:DUF960 domain-containing protein [Lacticaseibacillus parakribbianus]